MENNFCTHCGAKLEEDAKFCTSCGKAINDFVIPPVKTASWWILAVILGALLLLSFVCFVI